MLAIKNYNDTLCELKILKKRLNLLEDKKEQLWCKYFSITSKQKEIIVDGGNKINDNEINYLAELNKIDICTGYSLMDEIKILNSNIKKLQNALNEMKKSLSKLTGIEYQLYYLIVIDNLNISKAISIVAERNKLDERTVWRNYYKKIKNEIKKIKKI